MLVSQELYYTTKGSYKHRKSLTVFYLINPSGYAEIISVLYKEELGQRRPQGLVAKLHDIEVTATRFKDFEKIRERLLS